MYMLIDIMSPLNEFNNFDIGTSNPSGLCLLQVLRKTGDVRQQRTMDLNILLQAPLPFLRRI